MSSSRAAESGPTAESHARVRRRVGRAPDSPHLGLQLLLTGLHPWGIVPLGDLDRAVAEQLRHALQRDALEEQGHRERVPEAMGMTVRDDRIGRRADVLKHAIPALEI